VRLAGDVALLDCKRAAEKERKALEKELRGEMEDKSEAIEKLVASILGQAGVQCYFLRRKLLHFFNFFLLACFRILIFYLRLRERFCPGCVHHSRCFQSPCPE